MSTLERIEKMEKDLEQALKAAQNTQRVLEILAQRQMAAEQSNASLGKIISSVARVLVEECVITDLDIFKAMRSIEEEQDRKEVQILVDSNTIAVDLEAKENSLIVVEQEIVGDEDSKVHYRLYRLHADNLPETFVKDIVGKQVGENVIVKVGEELLKISIKEIYTPVSL